MMKAASSQLDTLRESLGPLPEPVVEPPLVMVCGLPGTGKSYFCRRLLERLDAVRVESDSLRKALFPHPTYTAEESAYLFSLIHQLVDELLSRGIPVVYDATNLAEGHREYLYNIARRHGARLILVRVEAPPRQCASGCSGGLPGRPLAMPPMPTGRSISV
jgi:predicted kinase